MAGRKEVLKLCLGILSNLLLIEVSRFQHWDRDDPSWHSKGDCPIAVLTEAP